MSLKMFISYARVDTELKDEFLTHLASLRRQKLIESWHDQDITASLKLHNTIADELGKAQLICLLISPAFMGSDYINNVEVPMAFSLQERGLARMVPIILKPCDWTSSDIAQFQGLPKNGKAITTFEDRDDAWVNVIGGLREIILRTDHRRKIPEQIAPSIQQPNQSIKIPRPSEV